MTEHVELKLVKRTGSTRFQHNGRATGTVSGSVASRITISHSVVLKGTVTITTSRGRMRLDVDGRARSVEQKTRFDGKATITGGTGHYVHARGGGTFTGIVDRTNWAARIEAHGVYTS